MPHPTPPQPELCAQSSRQVWWFSDGKPGHVSQVRGLINALRQLGSFELVEIDCRPGNSSFVATPTSPPPLILGAGRRTHRPMLKAKRATGGLAVVLMHPVWATGHRKRGFDLYVVPEHDGLAPADDVLLTTGALNPLTAEGAHNPTCGLLLIGGPARRYGWNPTQTLEQLRTLVDRTSDITTWQATSSRRTPESTEAQLQHLDPRVTFTPAADTPRGWVAQALAAADQVWVTEDSVSMIFEALTAGCRVGLLPLPYRPGFGERFLGWGPGRVASGVKRLIERGQVTPYADWLAGRTLCKPPAPVAEAQRVAQWVWQRWGNPR
ncbi:MAG: ELM1/GtrOC1 family putative glycosyltransferase [Algisphaera sp.]